jgi:hypothetical protein
MILPNVSAPALHEVFDAIEVEVIAANPTLSRFVPPRAPLPWLYHDGEWWPKPDERSAGEPNEAALPIYAR